MSTLAPITAAAAHTLVDSGALLIDVRSAAGRASSGTIPQAVVVAKTDVASFAEAEDADRAIVVFCGSIEGSGPFVDYLDEHGFTNVAHVDGGFDALKSEGLPTEEPTAQPA